MTKNTNSLHLLRITPRKRSVQFRMIVLGLAALTICLSGCASDPVPAKKSASAKERAIYWRKLGYNFDPRWVSADALDLLAANYTPRAWNEFKAGDLAAKKEQKKLESFYAAAARKAERENVATAAARAHEPPSPTPIEPRINPLPTAIEPKINPLPKDSPLLKPLTPLDP